MLLAAGIASLGAARAPEHAIDTAKSKITVWVYLSASFNAFYRQKGVKLKPSKAIA